MSSYFTTAFVGIGAILCFITLHSAYALTKAEGHTVVKWVYPVVVAVTLAFAVDTVESIQGYAIEGAPIGEFEYITHEMEGESALLLVGVLGTPRFYRFEPTEEQKQGLDKAKEGKEKGQQMKIKITEHSTEANLIRIDQLYPKESR
jgi:hypothetical protein